MRGWRKGEPGHSRPGCPLEAAFVICSDLCSVGHAILGAAVLVHHNGYYRPNGLLSVRKRGIVVPMPGLGGFYQARPVTIRPLDRDTPAKVGPIR